MKNGIYVIAVLRTPDVIRIIGSLVATAVLVVLCYAVVSYLMAQGRKSEPVLRIPALPPEKAGFDSSGMAKGLVEAMDPGVMSQQHESGESEE